MIRRYYHTTADAIAADCGRVEREERMGEDPLQECPRCGRPIARLIELGQKPVTRFTPTHH